MAGPLRSNDAEAARLKVANASRQQHAVQPYQRHRAEGHLAREPLEQGPDRHARQERSDEQAEDTDERCEVGEEDGPSLDRAREQHLERAALALARDGERSGADGDHPEHGDDDRVLRAERQRAPRLNRLPEPNWLICSKTG